MIVEWDAMLQYITLKHIINERDNYTKNTPSNLVNKLGNRQLG